MAAIYNTTCTAAAATSTATNYSLSISQDLLQQIVLTHTTNDQTDHRVDLQHLVNLINSIFQYAAAASKGTDQYANLNGILSSTESFEGMHQALDDIRSISCEMSCNLSAGIVEETTLSVLRRLRNYSWNAKVVVAMAAFASCIAELSMVLKHRNTDPIAKSVTILKGHSSTTVDFSVLENLGIFKAMIDLVNTNLSFFKIPKDAPSMKECAVAFFPYATYKILRTVLKIASIISKTQDNVELTALAKEVRGINVMLQEKLEFCIKVNTPYTYINAKLVPRIGISELFAKINNLVMIQVRVNITNKHLLLLVSDLDISIQEIKTLNKLYQSNQQRYQIVWLPIVDLSAFDEERFRSLKQLMKWIVLEPSVIEQEIIQFIIKEWRFLKNPIAVSVNAEGQVTCQNALFMLWTWGNLAFPFTEKRELDLWSQIDEQSGWRLELLLGEIVPDIRSWTYSETTFVCLFGGGDISWIREFTEKVRYAAYTAGISLKLVYVGKNKAKAIERKELSGDINVIESELQWQFWTRLESILNAKIRHGKTVTSYKNDKVIQEALKVVGYGGHEEAWAMFSMGPGAMVTTDGELALTIMSNYLNWKDTAGLRFLEGLKNYKTVISKDVHGCIEARLPVMGDQIPGIMLCPGCSKVMKMFYTYCCCAE